MNKVFEITFNRLYDKRLYKATVEVLQQTNNIITFKVTGGGKIITLKKYLFRKSNDWQMIDSNFQVQLRTKESEALYNNITKEINKKLVL